jgi:hypothetical protein
MIKIPEVLLKFLQSLKTMAVNKIRKLRKYSQKQERQACIDLDAKVEAASGATKFGGADGRRVNEIRIECKFTDAEKYSLKLEDLEKLRKQAIIGGLEDPVFQLEFRTHKLKYAIVPFREDWYILPFIGTGQASLNLRLVDLVKYTGIKVYPDDAILRIGFWNDTISTDVKPKEFLIFTWNDYLNKRKKDANKV